MENQNNEVKTSEKEKSEAMDVNLSSDSNSTAEALRQEGLRFFVDSGEPVDENLVSPIVKEVILENYKSSVGQRTSEYDERMQHVAAGPSKKAIGTSYDRIASHGAAVTAGSSGLIQDAQTIPGMTVSTPRPTPRGSSYTSPQPSRVPTLPDTLDFTPESSHAEQYRRRMQQADGRLEMYDSESEVDGKVLFDRGEYGSIDESASGSLATSVNAFLPMNPSTPMLDDISVLCLLDSPMMVLESTPVTPLSPVEFSPMIPYYCFIQHRVPLSPLWTPPPRVRPIDFSPIDFSP